MYVYFDIQEHILRWWIIFVVLLQYIQGDLWGKTNNLRGDSTYRSKIIVHWNMCLVLNGNWDKTIWIHESKRTVNGKKHKLFVVNLILILMFNGNFVTFQNKCWKIPAVILKAFCNSCVKIANFSSEMIFRFLYALSSIQNAR